MSVDGGRIDLSIHDDYVVIDSDYDSSLRPPSRIIMYGLGDTQDFYVYFTYAEAELAYERLGLLLGHSGTEANTGE